jgi:hypothetical protein
MVNKLIQIPVILQFYPIFEGVITYSVIIITVVLIKPLSLAISSFPLVYFYTINKTGQQKYKNLYKKDLVASIKI